ncbi:cathepsin L-like [Centruroides sculpturatus]|uniref:cathepsin L-like n=1 Tax=Centruroides sculpturatus TaxID=218467 RepID=UPI000C6EA477|nr:cathepsin L-like [Centruroides sculpturatus]
MVKGNALKWNNEGCEGGLMDNAFEYVKVNKGIDTEDSYPYEAMNDKCRFKRSSIGATCTGYVDVKSGDEEALKQAVATIGPISVSIDASADSFATYVYIIYTYKFYIQIGLLEYILSLS